MALAYIHAHCVCCITYHIVLCFIKGTSQTIIKIKCPSVNLEGIPKVKVVFFLRTYLNPFQGCNRWNFKLPKSAWITEATINSKPPSLLHADRGLVDPISRLYYLGRCFYWTLDALGNASATHFFLIFSPLHVATSPNRAFNPMHLSTSDH